MTTIVLPQLVEAEAQLAAQEADLTQQLAELQDKIKGIQTVIAMFNGPTESNGKVAAAAVVEVAEVEEEAPVVEVVTAAPAPKAKAVAKAAKTPKTARAGRPKKGATEKKAPSAKKAVATKKAATTKKVATTTKTAKRAGKSANWQSYVREDFSKTPLPDIVENILKAQPKSVFKIAAVMSEIFPEDMPKAHFLKARNRISNILSAGARTEEWYRGRGGTYSCSEKALKTA